MKTIALEQPGQFRLHATEAPQTVGRDEALVRVRRVGICGTDLHAFEGTQPFLEYPQWTPDLCGIVPGRCYV